MPEAPSADLNPVLAVIAARSDCQLLSPAGPAWVPDGVALPDDVRRFHVRCGGAVLFAGAEFPWYVGVPDRVVAASPRLLTPEMATRVAIEYPEDLTNGCYVIADGGRDSSTDPNIVIDLHPERLGRCYVAFWDTYGVVGEMPLVALTMAELLQALLEQDGRATALPDLYGDAYEPRLPWQPKRTVELDTEWLSQWRDDMTEVIASVMPMFEARMGYPPGDNRVGRPLDAIRLVAIAEMGQDFPPDLALFSRVVGGLSLPDIGNGWFVLRPLHQVVSGLRTMWTLCCCLRRQGHPVRGPSEEGWPCAAPSRGGRDSAGSLRRRAGQGVRAASTFLPGWSAGRGQTLCPQGRHR